ncbi:MAG: sodium:calcium antiporter [Armatimonadota bacterium]
METRLKFRQYLLPVIIAFLATLPGIVVRVAHIHLPDPLIALIAGTAILGASFLLLWACDAAQKDISQALAIAFVALIAVLPEYAVDMYFTWQAGQNPQSEYAHYAIANMTGANRLLIGVAWGAIALIFWVKTRRAVQLGKDRRTELLFLGIATVYAFIIPLKGSLAWYDGVVFLAIYGAYVAIAGRRPCIECEIDGPAELICAQPKLHRRLYTIGLFLFSALVILANAEPFSEGLIGTGKVLQINEFFLVQWLAPIASEAPEFTVAIMFALRGQAGLALGSLLSSKLNQWTLLVGMIPGVYGLSAQTLKHPMPMNGFQMSEILLTAAQSLLAVIILASMRFSIRQAGLLFGLFFAQLVSSALIDQAPEKMLFGINVIQAHMFFTVAYVAVAVGYLIASPRRLHGLWQGRKVHVEDDECCTLAELEEQEEDLVEARLS